jgi:RNA polymerase sigma-70 factor (ECF subfamily)
MDSQQILAQGPWLRALARGLVRNESVADDLVQDAWTAALRRPPPKDRPLRPWLARVLRNAMLMRLRGERRRLRREDDAGHGDVAEATTAEQATASAQAHARLLRAVEALEEPYRATIVLRYFEGQSASDIAHRQGIPAGTVRWRLKEALARLRARLDDEFGGERAAWQLALVPLARTRKGALSMKTFAQVAVFAGVAAGGVVMLHQATRAQVTAAPPLPEVQLAGRARDRRDHDQLLERIRAARPRGPAPAVAIHKHTPTPPGSRALDKDYIREQMQSLLPLMKGCYEEAAERNPALGGRIVVRFTIEAEPDIGGVVGETGIVKEGSTISDPGMIECVTETLYAARFPAPHEGGVVNVSYPFTFIMAGDDGSSTEE